MRRVALGLLLLGLPPPALAEPCTQRSSAGCLCISEAAAGRLGLESACDCGADCVGVEEETGDAALRADDPGPAEAVPEPVPVADPAPPTPADGCICVAPATAADLGFAAVSCACPEGQVGVDEAQADALLARDHADRTVGPVPPPLPSDALRWTLAALAALAAILTFIALR